MESDIPEEVINASRWRLLIAGYIDYCFFDVLWTVGLFLSGLADIDLHWKLLGFVLFEGAMYSMVGSLGQVFLSVTDASQRYSLSATRGNPFRTIKIVDSGIYHGENWFSILLAVFLVLDGSKECMRWAMWTPPLPHFGLETNALSSALISIMFGAGEILSGYYILKLRRIGFHLLIACTLTYTASVILGWSRWDAAVEQMVIRRRAFQGLPVREGEVELVQKWTPEGLIVVAVLLIIGALIVRKRLRR